MGDKVVIVIAIAVTLLLVLFLLQQFLEIKIDKPELMAILNADRAGKWYDETTLRDILLSRHCSNKESVWCQISYSQLHRVLEELIEAGQVETQMQDALPNFTYGISQVQQYRGRRVQQDAAA